MPEPVEEDCPICTSSQRAKERFAAAKVAEHIKEKARRDEAHRAWIDKHTSNRTLAEIRSALDEHNRPRH
jgi:transposase-like protein